MSELGTDINTFQIVAGPKYLSYSFNPMSIKLDKTNEMNVVLDHDSALSGVGKNSEVVQSMCSS